MEQRVNRCEQTVIKRNQTLDNARLAKTCFYTLALRTPRQMGLILSSLFILLVGTMVSGCQAAPSTPAISSTPAARGANGVPSPAHIVVVMEENHAYNQIIGASNAPYINSLANSGALFSKSFGITHPSQPNYLAIFSGSTQGITDNSCPLTFSGPDLGGELLNAGKTFVGYAESLPSVGSTACSSDSYQRKHNPWADFTDVPSSDNQPFTSFPTDFTKLPTVSFVVPDQLGDMHDGTVEQADGWLKTHLDAYVQWAKTHNSLLIVTWDEDDDSQNNQIATIFVGQMVKTGYYGKTINHYNILRTLEDAYGLSHAHNSASASPIIDCWQ